MISHKLGIPFHHSGNFTFRRIKKFIYWHLGQQAICLLKLVLSTFYRAFLKLLNMIAFIPIV